MKSRFEKRNVYHLGKKMFVCYTTSNCCFLHWKRMWYSSQLWSHGDLNMNIQSRSHVDRDQKEDSWCLQHLHEESTYKQWSYIINLIKITHDKASTNVRAFHSSPHRLRSRSNCLYPPVYLIISDLSSWLKRTLSRLADLRIMSSFHFTDLFFFTTFDASAKMFLSVTLAHGIKLW